MGGALAGLARALPMGGGPGDILATQAMARAQLSIDIGGTFTDVLVQDADGRISSRKLPNGAGVLSQAIAAGIAAVDGGAGAGLELLYSTTVTLNSLLTGTLPAIGLVVTQGFRDLMETARFAPAGADQPAPRRLVALEHVREIGARLAANGAEKHPLDTDQVEAIAAEFDALGIAVVAVALLHSYRNPVHERAVAAIFARVAPAIRVIQSAQVLPELREYERALATCLNACLVPVLEAHLAALGRATEHRTAPLYLMQASGGLASADRALAQPLATALSGPGAAIIGMSWLGRASGYEDLITLDIGGTSTDVGVVRGGRHALTTAGQIGGFPLKLPMVDVLSIGAGGGSIVRAAPDGRWHVGPASAGAEPGPVCYRRGGREVTLTDAELALGRLPEALLGGALPLDRAAAMAALAVFGAGRGLDAVACARGILEIASHALCGAVRRVTMLRGHDPQTLALFAMGGAGPLHAAELAELLGVRTVVVPPQPGLAAAFGLLVADLTAEFVRGSGLLESLLDPVALEADFALLESEAETLLEAEGIAPAARVLERKLDLRYAGMMHEVTVDCPPGPRGAALIAATLTRFHERFEAASGHSYRERSAVEVVNLRLTARGQRRKPHLPRGVTAPPGAPAVRARRPVQFLGQMGFVDSAIVDRASLGEGSRLDGPAVVEQFESTVVVPPGWSATGDLHGNLILQPSGG